MRYLGWIGGLILLLTATCVFSETMEFPAYFLRSENGAPDDFDRLHANRATIGAAYTPAAVPDADVPNGMLFVETRIGVGTRDPQEQLHLTGNLRLPLTEAGTGGTVGRILSDGQRYLHTPVTDTHLRVNAGYSSFQTNVDQVALGFTALQNDPAQRTVAIGAGAMTAGGVGDLLFSRHFGEVAAGFQAMGASPGGNSNVAVGHSALQDNTSGAILLLPTYNTAIGSAALSDNTEGLNNTAAGADASRNNTTGSNNTVFGWRALLSNLTGSGNTAVGKEALYSAGGSNNTAVGYQAGYSTAGSGSLFLGYQAGYSETDSNKLYIDNSNTATPLIYGDFTSNLVGVNSNLSVGSMTPPGTAPNGQSLGNANVNDIYLTATNSWMSAGAGGGTNPAPVVGTYVGTGAVKTISLNSDFGAGGMGYVVIASETGGTGEKFNGQPTSFGYADHRYGDIGLQISGAAFTVTQNGVGNLNVSGRRYYFIAYSGPVGDASW